MSETKALQAEEYGILNKAFPDDKDIPEFSAWLARILDERAVEEDRWYHCGQDPEFLEALYRHIKKEPLLRACNRRAWCVAATEFLSLELTVDRFFTYRKKQQALIAELKDKFTEDKDLEAFSHYLVASLARAATWQGVKVWKRESDAQRRVRAFTDHVFKSVEERRAWCAGTDEFIDIMPRIRGFFDCRNGILESTPDETQNTIWRAKDMASAIHSARRYNENDEDNYHADFVYRQQGALGQYEEFLDNTQFEYKQFIACLMHQAGHDELREALCACFKEDSLPSESEGDPK